MKNCGAKLRNAREFLGLTLDQVAAALNLKKNIIVDIENNNCEVKIEELYNLLKLYGITVKDIVSNKTEREVNLSEKFNRISKKDKKEIISLIKFKNEYKG